MRLNRVLSMVLLALVIPSGAWAADTLPTTTLYVSAQGNNGWSGALASPNEAATDGPFADLERARDEIRKRKASDGQSAGGITVLIRGGQYFLEQCFTLSAEDAAAPETPVTYAAYPNESVQLVGGKPVTGFQSVTDPVILDRLEPAARGQVMQADLKAQGITDFGAVDGGGMALFFQDKPMVVARWPNEGFVKIVEEAGGDKFDVRGTWGDRIGRWVYDGDRPKRWTQENNAWVHGYWFWDWSDQRQKVKVIDTEKHIIEVEKPYHNYGYRKGQWYYAFNLLSEIDMPGEWYVDRESGILYFWPPAPIESGQVVVSILPNLVKMDNAANVTLKGMTLEVCRSTAAIISGGENNMVAACVIHNTGASAVSVSGGSRHRVVGCDLYDLGGGGISLEGGDRTTLIPAGHCAENNHIHHYGRWARMYQAAISMNGVGNRAAHNLIHDAPHMAIFFGGNDHIIEYNEIHDVCTESNDAGAIYAGRNWTMRGNKIQYNYLHHITGFENRGCVGVYLDDMFASAAIYGNLFYQVTMAAFIGGGRDCSIENNVFVDCNPALHVDARALNWAAYHADEWIKEAGEKGTVSGIAYNKPPYSERYPQLLTLIEDEPKAPKGNVIARNICRGGKWDNVEEVARPYLTFTDNLLDQDPGFVNAEKQDYRLKDDSPAFKLGFKPIPIEQIGLRQDALRTSWPVEHSRQK